MKFLSILFLIIFVIPFLLRTVLKFLFGNSTQQSRSSNQNKNNTSSRTQKSSSKKKVFSKNDGEYVDYEVIKDK